MSHSYKPTQDTEWKSLEYNKAEWQYVILGGGKELIVLFPGGMRRPIYGGNFVKELAKDYRIIIPVYPRISKLKAIVEGITAIIAKEKFENTHIYGSSFGGLVAQAFMYYKPEKVKNIIISNTGTVNDDKDFRKRIKRLLILLRIVPAFVVRRIMLRSFIKLIPHESKEYDEIVAKLRYIIKLRILDKHDIICHFESLIDFQENIHLTPDKIHQLETRMLIITSENDPGVSPTAFKSLKNLYPHANFYHFAEGGHMPLLIRENEFTRLVKDQLLQKNNKSLN